MQESALIALGKLHQFEVNTNFDAWMAQIVRNVANNARRKRARRRSLNANGSIPKSAPAPTQAGESLDGEHLEFGIRFSVTVDFDDNVLEALQNLDEIPRTCLLMRIILGHSYREIASTLDIAEVTAMSHVHRSRKRLRDALAPIYMHGSASHD